MLKKHYLFSSKLEKDFVLRHENLFERILEILPGSLTWLALTSPIWLSFTLPYAVAYLILIADVYWLLNALKIGVLILIGYHKMEEAKKVDWLSRLKSDYPNTWENFYHLILVPTYKEPVSVLGPTFDAIINSNYPTKKIFVAVGFEERDDAEKIEQTKACLKKIRQRARSS